MIDDGELERTWPADEPPPGFAERVVARVMTEQRRKQRLRRVTAAVLMAAAAAAVALIVAWPPPIASGSRTAHEREEVALGKRATAVLEAEARIAWHGDVVKQEAGDVFYRVTPGDTFRVETPAGDVTVLGTCFRVRVRPPDSKEEQVKRQAMKLASAATVGALAVVTVYEGKVAISHAGERAELSAGQSGRLDARGARRLEGDAALGAAERALAEGDRDDYAKANDELAREIGDLNRRLRGLEQEKKQLNARLSSAQERLALADGGAVRLRSEFDLNQEDWAELAKDGTIKYRVPCFRESGWLPNAEQLDRLGLAPDDASVLQEAYKKSNDRVWQTIRRLCVDAIGKPEVVDTLGPDTCTHVVFDMAKKQDGEAFKEAMHQVGEIRAGQRPAPASGTPLHPVTEMFLVLTGELPRFENDLAQSFGPEEAHRLAYSEEMCAGHSTFGGPGPRAPQR